MIDIPDQVADTLRARVEALRKEGEARFPDMTEEVKREAESRLCSDLLDGAVDAFRLRWPQADAAELVDVRDRLAELLEASLHRD